MIRVLVVDDHPVVRQGLVAVLGDEPDLTVVGAAGSAHEAVAAAGRERPDVVLLDLELPAGDGAAAIPALRAASPGCEVLVFTAYATEERVLAALRAGARGYLLKGASTEEISRGIRIVHQGGSYLAPRIAGMVLAELGHPGGGRERLSPREREVLRLVAEGQSNKQIAQGLTVTERTVKFHVASLLRKLGADNRAQAVALASQRGLL